MTKQQDIELLRSENVVDDRCAKFIIMREFCVKEPIHILESSVFVGKKHFLNIMKRNTSIEDHQTNIDMISAGLTAPVRELLQLKQFYKFKAFNARLWSSFWCFWFIIAIISLVLSNYQRFTFLK